MKKSHALSLSVVATAAILSGPFLALAEDAPGAATERPPLMQRMMQPIRAVGGLLQGERMMPPPPRGDEGQRPGSASSTPPVRRPEEPHMIATSTTPTKVQLQRMLKQTTSMASIFSRNIKELQTSQQRLTKLGLTLSTDCQTAISNATTLVASMKAAQDADAVLQIFQTAADSQDTLQNCRDQARRLMDAPMIMKSLQKMIDRLKKAKVDTTALQSAFNNDVQPAFVALKSAASQDDVDAFFDAADSFRDDLAQAFDGAGIDTPRELEGIDGGATAQQKPQSFFGVPKALSNVGAAIMSVFHQ